jgi:hypothetical protein
MAEELKLEPNKPQKLAVKYQDPKILKGKGGRLRAMFTLEDRRVWFCDLETAELITKLVKPGEQFWMELRSNRGEPAKFEMWLDAATEWNRARKSPEPIPQPAPARSSVHAPASNDLGDSLASTVQNRTANETRSQEESWARYLRKTTTRLTDIYAECVKDARKHGETVKPEDVRSILLSTFIAATRRPPRRNRHAA